MISLLKDLPKKAREALRREELPTQPKPMLAVLAEEGFSDPDWIFERKLDGERALTVCGGRRVRLVSRNGKDVSDSYPELVDALEEACGDRGSGHRGEGGRDGHGLLRLVLDGEIVAFSDSVTSFSRLQRRMHISDPEEARQSPVAVYYYLFDVLHLDGFDVTALPLRTRKNILRDLFSYSDPIRFTAHRNEEGLVLFREACRSGWEGVIAKRAASSYVHARSSDWQKFKCVNRQELIIGGFTDPGGSRTGFGALLVGHFDGDKLRYAGKVGTGFDEETLRHMARLLKSRERKTSPFAQEDSGELPSSGVHWVTPNLVGQFAFTEWTTSGKLRHPRFMGLRRDKDPKEVVREEPG